MTSESFDFNSNDLNNDLNNGDESESDVEDLYSIPETGNIKLL